MAVLDRREEAAKKPSVGEFAIVCYANEVVQGCKLCWGKKNPYLFV